MIQKLIQYVSQGGYNSRATVLVMENENNTYFLVIQNIKSIFIEMLKITNDITVDDITVRNCKVTKAFVFDIPMIIDGGSQVTKQAFWDKAVYTISWGLFLLQYNNQEDRDSDANLFKKLFQQDGFFSKKWVKGYQIPENAGEFEYKGLFYIVLNTYNKLISGSDSISIQGVVIDISAYERVVIVENTVRDVIR